ncbi:MAG: pyridoxamine 5'-phosphate oxidase family protein [Gemmataceae bacterium]|nr:pyridoxamine 5'-phosphate oxidase family protein [Gemmataceae bacterium]
MAAAPWRVMIDRALDANRELRHARYLQLATLDTDSRPANRTVVFRGFRAGTDQLCVTTDVRSAKAEQLSRSPTVELCWFFPQTMEQFRLNGTARLIGPECRDPELLLARQAVWQALDDRGRLPFAWPQPGAARADEAAFAVPAPDRTDPPATFGVLLIDVTAVDHLDLVPLPPVRRTFVQQADGHWRTVSINP